MSQHDGSADQDTASPPGMPRWVKAAAVVVGLLLVIYLVLVLTGDGGHHGPGMHSSSGASGASGASGTGAAGLLPAGR